MEDKKDLNLNSDEIKAIVRDRYGQIARQAAYEQKGCCGSDSCCDEGSTFTPEGYTKIAGHESEADLGLGCGIPTGSADIRPGDTVVDLGSGAGSDAFIVRRFVGENGKVIGVDMTPEMIEKARTNNRKLGYTNVEFVLGEIERVPLADGLADVVVSNCVFNLLPNKRRGFNEVARILKSGGHFSISDIVTTAELPDRLRQTMALYTGCVAGALTKEEYLSTIRAAGFENISVTSERVISLPEGVLPPGLSVLSVTVYGEKSRNS